MDFPPRKKPGRPRLPEHERRTKVLRVRMTNAEIDDVSRAARCIGLSDSKFVRDVLRREAERVENVATRIAESNVRGGPEV